MVQKVLSGVIQALAFLSAAGAIFWFLIEPRAEEIGRAFVEAVFSHEIEALTEATRANANAVATLSKAIDTHLPRDIVEFNGSPILLSPGPFEPGGTVPIGYSLRRRAGCPTEVLVQFISARLQRIDTSLAYPVPAVQAATTDLHRLFVVDVRLPDHITPGRYSYAPELRVIGIGCEDDFEPVTIPPPSPFFEVVAADAR